MYVSSFFPTVVYFKLVLAQKLMKYCQNLPEKVPCGNTVTRSLPTCSKVIYIEGSQHQTTKHKRNTSEHINWVESHYFTRTKLHRLFILTHVTVGRVVAFFFNTNLNMWRK